MVYVPVEFVDAEAGVCSLVEGIGVEASVY